MNWNNNQMRYSYFIGFMDCFKDEGRTPFKTFIDKANELIDNFGFRMNFDEFQELIFLYGDEVEEFILRDDDDDDGLLYYTIDGEVVFINDDYLIETISIETINFQDFKKLKFNEKSE